jgi:hypothetical protein
MVWPWYSPALVTSVTEKMKKLIVLLIIGAIGWQAYGKYQRQVKQPFPNEQPIAEQRSERPVAKVFNVPPSAEQPAAKSELPVASINYRCDGRLHCNQMTSCEEANWFLRNCPGVKMDGDNDGLPCERGPC